MARTTDDLYDKLDELIDAISNGGGISRGRRIGSNYKNMDEYEASIEEIKHRYEIEEKLSGDLETRKKETYIGEIRRLEDLKKQNEDLLRDLFARNEDLKSREASLTEDERKEYEENLERIEKLSAANERNYEKELGYRKKLNEASSFGAMIKDLDIIKGKVIATYNDVKSLTDPWAKADHAVSKYAKSVGLAQKGMRNLRRDTLLSLTKDNIAAKYNINSEELIEAQSNYVKGIGRNVRLSKTDQENMAAMRAVTDGKGTELASLYENFGVSMSDTADHVGRMFSEAAEEGILFDKYAENVSKNIKIAQNYTFTNGLKGLESMAKKATALKLDMQQVAALADKVSTVEGAIDVSAKLQVLGGPFAQMADPLGMLNEGLNDMESLQDRMAKMIGGMGSFDKATGEVKVSAFNKQRIKAAAEAMGVSYDNLMESVNAQAKRGEIEKQISASTNAAALPDEMKELIKNSATFKDGKAGVSIRGQFKTLDELSSNDYEALQKETQTESQDIKDIAMDLRSIKDMREGVGKSAESWKARVYAPVANIEKVMTKFTSWSMRVLGPIVAAIAGVVVGNSIASRWSGGRGRFGSSMSGSGNRRTSSVGRKGRKIFDKVTKGLSKKGGFLGKIGGGLRKTKLSVIKSGKPYNRFGNNFMDTAYNTVRRSRVKPSGVRVNSAGRLIDAKTGRFISKNAIQNSGKNIIGGTIKNAPKGQIIKGGVGRTAKRASAKILGKTATKGLTTIAQNATTFASSTLGAVAGGLGIVGTVGNILTDRAVEKGKMKKGGTGHHLAKGASGAATGAAIGLTIGSIFPVIGSAVGTAVGAAIGGTIGLLKAGKAKQERKLEEKLEGTGIEVKGKYNRSKLKKINKGLERGEISDRMRRKLEKKGDTALLDKIDDTKIKKAEKKKKLLEAEGVLDNNKKKKLNIAKNRFGTANFTVGTANFGGRGLSSFTTLFGKRGSVMGGAIHYGKKAASSIKNAKDKADVIIKGVKENGISGAWEAIKANKGVFENNSGKIKENVPQKDFNININGTLKLTGENGQSVDIIGELRKNPQLLRSLADMISKEISYLDKGTNVVQKG